MTNAEIEVARAVAAERVAQAVRSERRALRTWIIALVAALATSVVSHACDNVQNHEKMRACVERAP